MSCTKITSLKRFCAFVFCFLSIFFSVSVYAAVPTVSGVYNSTPKRTSVQVYGYVNPERRDTYAYVRYKKASDSAYLQTSSVYVGKDGNNHVVSIPVNGLSPYTDYNYLLCAENVSGSVCSSELSIKTAGIPSYEYRASCTDSRAGTMTLSSDKPVNKFLFYPDETIHASVVFSNPVPYYPTSGGFGAEMQILVFFDVECCSACPSTGGLSVLYGIRKYIHYLSVYDLMLDIENGYLYGFTTKLDLPLLLETYPYIVGYDFGPYDDSRCHPYCGVSPLSCEIKTSDDVAICLYAPVYDYGWDSCMETAELDISGGGNCIYGDLYGQGSKGVASGHKGVEKSLSGGSYYGIGGYQVSP